jgi:uncharacterized protein
MASSRPDTMWGTLRQSAPRMLTVMRHMRPTWHMDSIVELTPAFAAQHGIRGIAWDIDGTLTAYHAPALLDEIAAPFRALTAQAEIAHVVVSNSPDSRYEQLGRLLPEIPVLRVYEVGAQRFPRQLLRGVDSMTSDEREAIASQGGHALRKPDAALLQYAVDTLGCAIDEVVMVGDQYMTDVAGAGMAGMRSIKVRTLGVSTFPWTIRGAQVLERLLYHVPLARPSHGRAARGTDSVYRP